MWLYVLVPRDAKVSSGPGVRFLGPGVRHAINLRNIGSVLLVDSNLVIFNLSPHLHMKIVIVHLNLVTSKLLAEISCNR